MQKTEDTASAAVGSPLDGRVRPRCGDCKRFYVPLAEPQWRHIGSRVGECTGSPYGGLRPMRGWMSAAVENETRRGWLKAGGQILVDADFGCVNFERPNVADKRPVPGSA